VTGFIHATQWFFLGYFVLMGLGYLLLDLLSLQGLRRYMDRQSLSDLPSAFSGLEPPVSILVPAYNESATIAASLRSLLQLHYLDYEIVVVNDGSRDDTLEVLKREFGLVACNAAWRRQLETKLVRGVYQSPRFPRLRVIDKENGGKADALNSGINFCIYPLFCAVDADSILQRDSLGKVVRPFLEDPLCIAAGGTVRIANGCEVKGGFLTRVGLPGKLLPLLQIVEYLRAFLFGRLGWEPLNGLLIISGAFGLFRRDVVVSVGGYRTDTMGEDMELVMRLHRTLRHEDKPYRIHFLADPICWTEAPEDLKTLRSQRVRWQRGLSESLSLNWPLLFDRKGGAPGWLAFPFMLLFEWMGPVAELIGIVFMIVICITGAVSLKALLVFLFVALSLGLLLSVTALLLEEMSFHIYLMPRQLVILLLVAVFENFGYRQLNAWWRLKGLWMWAARRKSHWGTMTRSASWQQKH
jgi:cellulose synthase/poly-beta-1,6-N-acetylglucosamine synthase-like glycosyltransferase